jgi:hypothetical protein
MVSNGFAQLADLALDSLIFYRTLLPIFLPVFHSILGGSCHA